MTPLRKLFDDASSAISLYKHPNIDECRKALNEVLNAADLGGIGDYDKVEDLNEFHGKVRIDTSWSARQCENTSTYEFPAFILDAEDPIKAATKWGLEEKLKDARLKYAVVQRQAEQYQLDVLKMQEQLDRL